MATLTTALILDGIAGGLVATVVMTIAMMALGDDSPPPTAAFLATYVGDGPPEQYVMPGMVLHLFYGTVAGVVLAAVSVLAGLGLTTGLAIGVGGGLVYGAVLFVGAAVFWMNVVLDMDPDRSEVGLFLLFHLLYGLVLGAWLGFGVLA